MASFLAGVFLLLGCGAANARAMLPQSATETWNIEEPLTGQALPCIQGKIKNFDCRRVELLAFLPKDYIGESAGYDVWGWTDSATGREFAIIGGDATAFVEVTDPVHPKHLGVLPAPDGNHTAQSVRVYQHYAFIGYDGIDQGLQVFDLAQLRDLQTPREFQPTAHYDQLGNVHTLALDTLTGFAYASGGTTGRKSCDGGLHIIDVHEPLRPTFAGCYRDAREGGLMGSGYIHETQCTRYHGPDARYRGRELCLAAAGSGLLLADVTMKTHPKTLSVVRYPHVGYVSQGWLSEDQRYCFIADLLDESLRADWRTRTLVFDLTTLDRPVLVREFYHSTAATDRALYVRGHYLYEANTKAGLRILDVADPRHPKEVGYFAHAGSSAWTVYPYFSHGVVAVSMDTGLFLIRLLPS